MSDDASRGFQNPPDPEARRDQWRAALLIGAVLCAGAALNAWKLASLAGAF